MLAYLETSAFPSYTSGVHHFGGDFSACDRVFFVLLLLLLLLLFFLNPTTEVVTLRLRRWCMLGVFLLSAFTRLGLECQDLLSPCDACVYRLNFGLYSQPKEGFFVCFCFCFVFFVCFFGGWVSMLTPWEKSTLPEKSLEEDRTHNTASRRTASPTYYRLGYSALPPPPLTPIYIAIIHNILTWALQLTWLPVQKGIS